MEVAELSFGWTGRKQIVIIHLKISGSEYWNCQVVYLHLLILIIAFYTLVVGIESGSQELWWCVRKHLVYHHHHHHYHQSQEIPLGNENCCNVTNGTNIPIFFSTTVSEKDITFEHVYGIWITRFGISVLVMSTLA